MENCKSAHNIVICDKVAEAVRPVSFLHDEMTEFNEIFTELINPKRRLSASCLPSMDDVVSPEIVNTGSDSNTIFSTVAGGNCCCNSSYILNEAVLNNCYSVSSDKLFEVLSVNTLANLKY